MRPRLFRLLMLVWLVACSSAAAAIDPAWGKQACAHCHMLVSDPRFAAQLITQRGDRVYFDDVGCMVEYLHLHSAEVSDAWVHESNAWIRAHSARYAAAAGSPMGYGFAPSASGNLDFAQLGQQIASARAARSAQ